MQREREREREKDGKKKKNYKTQSFAELATAMTTFPLRVTFAQGFIVVDSGCAVPGKHGRRGGRGQGRLGGIAPAMVATKPRVVMGTTRAS